MKRAALTPGLIAFVLSSNVRRGSYGLFRALQRLDRIHRSPIGVWLLAGHTEVGAALRDHNLSSDEANVDITTLHLGGLEKVLNRGNRDPNWRREDSPITRLMLFRDPPDHTRLRGLVSKAFTPRRVEAMEERINEVVDEHIERLKDARVDIMHDFAYPIPAQVICELVGVPIEDQSLIVSHAPALAAGLDPSPMRSQAVQQASHRAVQALTEYMTDLINRRRLQPGDDMLSALIEAEQDGDRLSEEDLIATVLLLLIAGHETTANLCGNALLALFRDRSSLERWREDDSLDRTAIEELLRYDPPAQMALRVALEPYTVGKEEVPKGTIIIPLIAAANRDPLVFDEPRKLNLAREENPHLAFGGGAHFCIGASLARLEGRIMLTKLIRTFPEMRPVRGGIKRRPSFTIRGLSKLEVTLR
jgi:cytochrome P450